MPIEFRGLLEGAGLSQSEAARQIGVSDRTIRRYLARRAAVPTLVVRAVMHVIEERGKIAQTLTAPRDVRKQKRHRGRPNA
jgi:ParB-like chromosome segregation protein Spo0J